MRLAALVLLLAALLAAPASAASGPALRVDAAAGRHAIDPDIYGMNFADPALAAETGLPVERWGGNRTETYNWRAGIASTAADWYWENIPDCWSDAGSWCSPAPSDPGASAAWRSFVAADRARGTRTLLALPLMGYVAKPATSFGHPLTCAFPAALHPAQDAFDPWDAGCGNGLSGGTPLSPAPLSDTMQPFGPADAQAWIADAVAHYGTAAGGGIATYELGNEPALWDGTDRAWRPQPTTATELWDKTRDMATAVKQADPTAATAMLSEWGWPNYFCAAADGGCSPGTGRYGGLDLAEWLLAQAHAYDAAHGGRLIDDLDLHYYSQGGSTTDITRSLWDPSYTDPSWIGARIALLPRMRAWVAAQDPGTRISLSEYHLSVPAGTPGETILDTLIQADTLGIFARERLDLATRWDPPKATDVEADAFRLFRDYDGHGGRFGETWIDSASDDQAQLAVYGAQRAADGALTVAVINKSTQPLTSPLTLAGATPAGPAQAYQWQGAGIARIADAPVDGATLTATYPARSMTLYVVPVAQPPAASQPPVTGGDAALTSTETAAPAPASSQAPAVAARQHCVVPAVTGHTLAGAGRLLARHRCRAGLIRRVRSPRRPGTVLRQSPAARRHLADGAAVALVLARR